MDQEILRKAADLIDQHEHLVFLHIRKSIPKKSVADMIINEISTLLAFHAEYIETRTFSELLDAFASGSDPLEVILKRKE